MAANFNLQAHLEAMEGRIREDIKECRSDIVEVKLAQANQDGRVKNLEDKAKWIGAGITASLAGVGSLAVAYVRQKVGL